MPVAVLGLMFLTPWFAAAGVALAAIPIVIHILNRRRFKTVSWAAMDYLLKAMRKNRRRLRFEQMLLLVTRCLVLALLGLALARPMGCENSALAAMGRRTSLNIYIIDDSYSMAYEANRPGAKTHLAQAKLVVDGYLDRPSSGGVSVAVIAAGEPAKLVIGKPTYDLQSAKAAVDRIEQSYGATDLVGALQAALQIARDESRQPNKNLYIITDGTRSAFEGPQAQAMKDLSPQLASTFHIVLHNLGQGRTQWNAAVTDLGSNSTLVTSKFPTEFKAVLQGFGTPHDADVRWKVDDQVLPGGGSTRVDGKVELTQSQAVFATGGPHLLSVSLNNGDSLGIDNTRYRVVDVASQLKTLIVEGKHGISPLEGSAAFIAAALAPAINAKGDTNSYISPELISDLDLNGKVLNDYRLIILADVGQFTSEEADRLQRFVEAGGALIYFMGDSVNKENYNSVLLPRKLMPGPIVKLISVGSDQHGYTFDFRPEGVSHRFLSAFAHQEDTGLDKAQIFTYWQVDAGANKGVETVLRYVTPGSGNTTATSAPAGPTSPAQAGDAAITHHSLGLGNIVFVSTLANKEWTNLPAHPNFPALLHEIVLGSARSGDYWLNLDVGQRLVIPASVQLTGTPLLTDSAQTPVQLEAPNAASQVAFEQTYHSAPIAKPGVYLLSLGNASLPVAVNVPAAQEANVFTLTDSAIHQAMGDVQMEMLNDQPPSESAVASGREGNDFSWWCMALVLLLVGFECLMAMRFGHHRAERRGLA